MRENTTKREWVKCEFYKHSGSEQQALNNMLHKLFLIYTLKVENTQWIRIALKSRKSSEFLLQFALKLVFLTFLRSAKLQQSVQEEETLRKGTEKEAKGRWRLLIVLLKRFQTLTVWSHPHIRSARPPKKSTAVSGTGASFVSRPVCALVRVRARPCAGAC